MPKVAKQLIIHRTDNGWIMTEANQDSLLGQVQNRVEDARGAVEETLNNASEEGLNALDEAVTVADESVDSASAVVNRMG